MSENKDENDLKKSSISIFDFGINIIVISMFSLFTTLMSESIILCSDYIIDMFIFQVIELTECCLFLFGIIIMIIGIIWSR